VNPSSLRRRPVRGRAAWRAGKVKVMAERARKLVKPIAAVLGLLATMASIWWFALKPRRKSED
jgi:hypothetical protein